MKNIFKTLGIRVMIVLICVFVISNWAIAQRARRIPAPERPRITVEVYDFSVQPIELWIPGPQGHWTALRDGFKLKCGQEVKAKYQVNSLNKALVNNIEICLYVDNKQEGCDTIKLGPRPDKYEKEVLVPSLSKCPGPHTIRVTLDPNKKLLLSRDRDLYSTVRTVDLE